MFEENSELAPNAYRDTGFGGLAIFAPFALSLRRCCLYPVPRRRLSRRECVGKAKQNSPVVD